MGPLIDEASVVKGWDRANDIDCTIATVMVSTNEKRNAPSKVRLWQMLAALVLSINTRLQRKTLLE